MSANYYPGQQIIASDGARYTLTHWAELTWWGQRSDGACALPVPCVPRYPAWGGDDDRAGADLARRSGVRGRRRAKAMASDA
jgi:hypothetical protein